MKSDIDPKLKALVLRATKFIHNTVPLGSDINNALAEVVECYIRTAHEDGQAFGLEQVKSPL